MARLSSMHSGLEYMLGSQRAGGDHQNLGILVEERAKWPTTYLLLLNIIPRCIAKHHRTSQ